MADYECPSCGGGFPFAAGVTADACPWCGEAMDGDSDDDEPLRLVDKYPPQPQTAPVNRTSPGFDLGHVIGPHGINTPQFESADRSAVDGLGLARATVSEVDRERRSEVRRE